MPLYSLSKFNLPPPFGNGQWSRRLPVNVSLWLASLLVNGVLEDKQVLKPQQALLS